MTRRRGEERTINRSQSRTVNLAAQDSQLVPQDDQLDVPDARAASATNEQAEQSPEREIGERKEHGADPPKPDPEKRHE